MARFVENDIRKLGIVSWREVGRLRMDGKSNKEVLVHLEQWSHRRKRRRRRCRRRRRRRRMWRRPDLVCCAAGNVMYV